MISHLHIDFPLGLKKQFWQIPWYPRPPPNRLKKNTNYSSSLTFGVAFAFGGGGFGKELRDARPGQVVIAIAWRLEAGRFGMMEMVEAKCRS